MRTLILTIETIGDEWDSLDEETHSILTSWIKRGGYDAREQVSLTESVKHRLRFSPYTGRISAMSLFDVALGTGVVYHSLATNPHESYWGNFTYKYRSEHEMLEDFWEGIQCYDRIVTFHGGTFHIPFIRMRSIAQRISPAVVFTEYAHAPAEGVLHVDLASPYGYGKRTRGRVPLRIVARGLGVVPESDETKEIETERVLPSEALHPSLHDIRNDTLKIKGLFVLWKAHLSPSDEE